MKTPNTNQHSTTKCLLAFGAGVALGIGAGIAARASTPKAFEIIATIMQRMGFELGDILLLLWDPEAPSSNELPAEKVVSPPRKRRKTSTTRRSARGTRLTLSRRNTRTNHSLVLY